jgi:hypothetical protein
MHFEGKIKGILMLQWVVRRVVRCGRDFKPLEFSPWAVTVRLVSDRRQGQIFPPEHSDVHLSVTVSVCLSRPMRHSSVSHGISLSVTAHETHSWSTNRHFFCWGLSLSLNVSFSFKSPWLGITIMTLQLSVWFSHGSQKWHISVSVQIALISS